MQLDQSIVNDLWRRYNKQGSSVEDRMQKLFPGDEATQKAYRDAVIDLAREGTLKDRTCRFCHEVLADRRGRVHHETAKHPKKRAASIDIEQMVEDYDAGMSVAQVAKIHGLSRSLTWEKLKEYGVGMRHRRAS